MVCASVGGRQWGAVALGVVSFEGRGCWPRVPWAGREAGQGKAVAA